MNTHRTSTATLINVIGICWWAYIKYIYYLLTICFFSVKLANLLYYIQVNITIKKTGCPGLPVAPWVALLDSEFALAGAALPTWQNTELFRGHTKTARAGASNRQTRNRLCKAYCPYYSELEHKQELKRYKHRYLA